MKKNINVFVKEFTDNFSELYVESFLMRFLNYHDNNELLECILFTNETLKRKINKKFIQKLNKMGYSNDIYKKYLK